MWKAFFAFHICIACCEFFRRQVSQRTVWAHPVVIDPPTFDGLSCIVRKRTPLAVWTSV